MEFLGFDISGIVLILKVIGSVLSVVFFVGIIISGLSFFNVVEIKKRRRFNYFNRDEVKQESSTEKRWNSIKAHFQSQNPAEWRMAIIDADSMLEDLITGMGYQGETFGEKLKSIDRNIAPWLNDVWQVHLLRNKLAHEGSSYHLSDREAYQTFKIYEHLFYSFGYFN